MPEQPRWADYLSVQEAAEYVGVSPQTLRRWDAAGKLKPVRHPVSGYRYYNRGDLGPYRLEYERAQMLTSDIGTRFQAPANIEGNHRLREPQREAHRAVREHFSKSACPAILQIPVGCGKTGIIATLPFGVATGRVLVITPNVTIRTGVSEELDVAGPKCFWKNRNVLTDLSDGPFYAVLDGPDANIHDCTSSHFVVTNIQQLASSADRWLPQFPPSFFDLILVDEGHHNAAESWRKVFERFPNAKVVSLTATPFRSDGKPLSGEVIYRYSFARAMVNGYIKEIHSSNVAPAEIYFTYKDDMRRHTLDEVLELREEQWFRKGVALAPECNRHIAESSIGHLQRLRDATGTHHQIIAAACSVDHARQVRSIYEEYGLRAKEIHSQMDEDAREAVLTDLKRGRLDCIVQVQMLTEGFDHPSLSVAAIFRPFRSLSPYIQFVGRIMRVIHQNEPGNPDNQGFVISHIGLNNDERWDDFRELDIADQELVHEWLTTRGKDEEAGALEEQREGKPRRFDLGMSVQDEIVSHFIGQSFLDPEDDRVLDQILSQPVGSTGLTVGQITSRENLREKLRAQKAALKQEPREIPVSPQRHRKSARKRLPERTKSVANRVLADLGLSPNGWEVCQAVPTGGRSANRRALIRLLNRAVNKRLGIGSGQRQDVSAEELDAVFADLDRLGDEVRDRIRGALGVVNG